MTDQAVLDVIARFEQKLKAHEAEAAVVRRMINALCAEADLPARYSISDSESGRGALSNRRDRYYGQPLAKAIRLILEGRKAADMGAATVAELYEELLAGGYKFEAKDDDNAKRGLRISLGKNPLFHRVPNGSYGLREWYPNAKASAEKGGGEEGESDSSED